MPVEENLKRRHCRKIRVMFSLTQGLALLMSSSRGLKIVEAFAPFLTAFPEASSFQVVQVVAACFALTVTTKQTGSSRISSWAEA
jgi:hypothetical protein